MKKYNNLLPSTTDFLMNACQKRLVKRFEECKRNVNEYNEEINKYNENIKRYNKNIEEMNYIISLPSEKKNSFDENHKKEPFDDIVEKNMSIEKDNIIIEKRNDKREYGVLKEYKSRKEQYFKKYIISNDPPLSTNIMNNKRTTNNRFLLNNSSLGSNEEKTGITYVLGFENRNEVVWGNNKEIQANLHLIHSCIIKDLIQNENEIKEHIKKERLYYYKQVIEFDFDEILYEFILYAIQKTYKKIIPNDLGMESIKKYYGVVLFDDEIISNIIMVNAINFIYTIPDYREKFNKSITKYMAKSIDNKNKRISPFSDKELLKNLIEPEIIPLLTEHFYNRNSLGRRVSEIIKYDLSSSKKLIEQNNYSEDELEELKRINKLSSKYAADLSEIQIEKMDAQLLDSFLF